MVVLVVGFVVVAVVLGIVLPLRLGIIALGLGAAIGALGRAELVTAWERHPTFLLTVGFALFTAAVVSAALRSEPSEPADEGHDDGPGQGPGGGGGGERRVPPAPTKPSSPCGLRPDWDAFDEARRGWERTPARMS